MIQPGPRPVTAVTVFHSGGDDGAFERWAQELLASAAAAVALGREDGFLATQMRLCAAAATLPLFATVHQLQFWDCAD